MSTSKNDQPLTSNQPNRVRFETIEADIRDLRMEVTRLSTTVGLMLARLEIIHPARRVDPGVEEEIIQGDRRTHGEERRSEGSRHRGGLSEPVKREVIQEARQTHGISPPPVEPKYETDEKDEEQVTVPENKEIEVRPSETVNTQQAIAVTNVAAANVAFNAELQAKLMAGAVLIASRVSSMQGEFGKVCKRKRKHVLRDEWETKTKQIMVLQDEMLEVLFWKFMHEENNKLLGLYEKAKQEKDEATWEGHNGRAKRISDVALEGKGILEGRGNDENLTRTRRLERLRLREREVP
ncbi:hypothetical protein ACOSP7_004773 [Xanthoceras sorbifolium]